MRNNNLVGVVPGQAAEQVISGETVRIGTWARKLKYEGRIDSDGKIKELLDKWSISYIGPIGDRIWISPAVSAEKPRETQEVRRSHLSANNAWVAEYPQRRGTIAGAEPHGLNPSFHQWPLRLTETPTIGIDPRIADAQKESGFAVVTSEGRTTVTPATASPASGSQARRPSNLPATAEPAAGELRQRTTDEWIAALYAYMKANPGQRGITPSQWQKHLMPNGDHVPIGRWLYSIKRKGRLDPHGDVARALVNNRFIPVYRENLRDIASFQEDPEPAAARTTPIPIQTQSTAHFLAGNSTPWVAWGQSGASSTPSSSKR